MPNFLSEFLQYILIILKGEIPCFYLDIFLVVLFILIHFMGLKIFGYEVSNFYYITFFGLFPYRLIKAVFGSETILIMSIPFLFGIFCLIWRYINFFIPFFFNWRFTQLFVAFSLLAADKFLFLFDILKKRPLFLLFFAISVPTTLFFCWVSLNYSSFFLLALVQSFAWYINFYKHFLASSPIEIFKKEASFNEWPIEASDFNWKQMTYIMYHVLKQKHNYRVLNKLGPMFNNFRYPNIAKHCLFPLADTTKTTPQFTILTIITIIGGVGILNLGLFAGIRTKFKISSLEKLVQIKKKDDELAKKQIINYDEEINNDILLANEYSSGYKITKRKLKEMGVKNLKSLDSSETDTFDKIFDPAILNSSLKENPFKGFSKNKTLEVLKLLQDLEFYKSQYILTVTNIEKTTLAQACTKKIVECDVKVIKINLFERLFTSNKEILYHIQRLGLKPDKLQEKAEKNSEIQALLKKTFNKQDCPPIQVEKIEKLNVEICPFLSPLFEECQKEFLNERIDFEQGHYNKIINLEKSCEQPTIKTDIEKSSSDFSITSFWES